jgi:NAD(P)H-hydrate epimerase
MEEFGIPGIILMENAGRGVAEVILKLRLPGPVHLLCGKGNNGGDGYVIARHLDAAGVAVVVHRCCEEADITGDALVHYQIVKKCGLPMAAYQSPSVLADILLLAGTIVDALLGTGLTGTVRSPYAEIIQTMRRSGKPLLAVDLPSGMDADTGVPLGECVVANHTVTFVAPKAGFAHREAHLYTGKVHVVQIGLPGSMTLKLS